MELYPSIPRVVQNTPIYAFDKLDGSNIRAEWTPGKGFTKFGTRTRLLDPNEPVLGEAVTLFQNKYADNLEKIFRKKGYQRATAFMEFYGENSFAGQHIDEPHDVVLFDVHVYKRGLLPAKEFIDTFEGKVDTPNRVYYGKVNDQFLRRVREGLIEGVTFEGVVCKGGLDNRRRSIMFKVKSQAWLDAVHARYGHDPKLLEKLI